MLLTYKIRFACNCDDGWECSVSGVIIVDAVCSKLTKELPQKKEKRQNNVKNRN